MLDDVKSSKDNEDMIEQLINKSELEKSYRSELQKNVDIINQKTSDKNNKLLLQDIFVYSKHHGKYISTGYVPTPLLSKMQLRNIELDRSIFNNK